MAEDRRVDILEHAGADETGLAAQQLLGDAGPDHQRPRRVRADHPVLHRQRRDDVHRLPAIVSLAMPRCALDHRLAPRDAGRLAGLRDAVDIAAQRDHRAVGAVRPPRRPPRRQARDVALDREAFLLEQRGQIPFGLMLLETDLRIAEQFVVDDLRQLRARLHAADHLGLGAARRGLRGGGASERQHPRDGDGESDHASCSPLFGWQARVSPRLRFRPRDQKFSFAVVKKYRPTTPYILSSR